MSTVEIRSATPSDKQQWLQLWQGYLDFYETVLDTSVTEMTWSRIVDPLSNVFCRLAMADGRIVGFANCVLHQRTWAVEPTCYLEDLYVDENVRGHGAGRALIDDLIAMGKRDGWTNLYWNTNAENERARRLYDSYDTADDYVRYRLPLNP